MIHEAWIEAAAYSARQQMALQHKREPLHIICNLRQVQTKNWNHVSLTTCFVFKTMLLLLLLLIKCQDYSAAIIQLQGNFTKFISKTVVSSTKTSADSLNGQRQVSRTTDAKGETWSPFGMLQYIIDFSLLLQRTAITKKHHNAKICPQACKVMISPPHTLASVVSPKAQFSALCSLSCILPHSVLLFHLFL